MSKTRAELIEQVLINLGKLGNDTPSAEDSDKVDRVVDPSIEDLAARDIYLVQDAGTPGASDGAIEDSAFLDLCHVVALEAAPAFNMAMDATLVALAERAENRLIIKAAPSRTRTFLGLDPMLRRYRRGFYNGGFY